nr:hypothetical protein [Tanacetum cinerariifolium]
MAHQIDAINNLTTMLANPEQRQLPPPPPPPPPIPPQQNQPRPPKILLPTFDGSNPLDWDAYTYPPLPRVSLSYQASACSLSTLHFLKFPENSFEKCVAMSTKEAEYMAIAEDRKELENKMDNVQNTNAYNDEDMGDVITGEPFCKEARVEARQFDGFINISDGNNSVTYQITRSHSRFKQLTYAQCNKIRPLLKTSH